MPGFLANYCAVLPPVTSGERSEALGLLREARTIIDASFAKPSDSFTRSDFLNDIFPLQKGVGAATEARSTLNAITRIPVERSYYTEAIRFILAEDGVEAACRYATRCSEKIRLGFTVETVASCLLERHDEAGARRIIQGIPDPRARAYGLAELADYNARRDRRAAFRDVEEALRLVRTVEDPNSRCRSYLDIADTLVKLGERDRAREETMRAYAILPKIKEKYQYSDTRNNFLNMLAALGSFPAALERADQAAHEDKTTNPLTGLGYDRAYAGDVNAALQVFERLERFQIEHSAYYGEHFAHILARKLMAADRRREAVDVLQRCRRGILREPSFEAPEMLARLAMEFQSFGEDRAADEALAEAEKVARSRPGLSGQVTFYQGGGPPQTVLEKNIEMLAVAELRMGRRESAQRRVAALPGKPSLDRYWATLARETVRPGNFRAAFEAARRVKGARERATTLIALAGMMLQPGKVVRDPIFGV